jgi:FKBP-type peptidyl-prolyl cis-trans isomerase (trigger factor)
MVGFRDILHTEITNKKEAETRQVDENTLMEQMLAVATFEVGPTLLSQEIDQIFREHASNLEQQGLDIKGYLEHVRKSETEYKETVVAPEALRRVKAELLLRKIKEIKSTDATDDEVKTEVDKVITQYSSPEVSERLKAKLVPGDVYYEDIKNRVIYRKVVDGFWA